MGGECGVKKNGQQLGSKGKKNRKKNNKNGVKSKKLIAWGIRENAI